MSDKLYGPLIDVAQALSRLATAHERVASMAEENRGYKPSGDAGPPINIAAGAAHRQRFAVEEELKIATSKLTRIRMLMNLSINNGGVAHTDHDDHGMCLSCELRKILDDE